MKHLKFEDWEPLYEDIISDFGYSKERDRRSAALLLKCRGTDSLSPLKDMEKRVVEIGGPYYSKADGEFKIAAGAALTEMRNKGVEPDLIVTDLDGDIELQLKVNRKGTPAVIHAHGDNIESIKRWSQKFDGAVISTCQCEPFEEGIYNFGGFTDGDRAAFLADHFGAEKVVLNGWDFEDPYEDHDGVKLKKLRWARRLLIRLDVPIEHL